MSVVNIILHKSEQKKLFPREKSLQALMMLFVLQVQSISAQQLCRHLWQLLQPDDRLQAPRGGAEDGGEADRGAAGGRGGGRL